MKSSALLEKINLNVLKTIEINGKMACGSETFENKNINESCDWINRKATYMGNNQAFVIGKKDGSAYDKNIQIHFIDLITKAVVTKLLPIPDNFYPYDRVMFKNTENPYVAISLYS